MPYIVKSSLDIGGKILPWNEQETNKLIKEKKEYFENKEEEFKKEVVLEKEDIQDEEQEEKEKTATSFLKDNKKNQKAGEK